MANPIKPIVASSTPPASSPVVDGAGRVTPVWLRVFQDAAGYIAYELSWAAVTPDGINQATAPELSTRNVILATAGAAGVRLPMTPFVGQKVLIINSSGAAQDVYPGVGGQLGLAGVNVPVSLANGAGQNYTAYSATQWYLA